MSISSRSDSDTPLDVEELFQIGTRCRQLRKEKDKLKSSQSQSFELIRLLELHEKSMLDAHTEDKKHIQRLEKELLNYSQEIDYLQDQLNSSNTEVNHLKKCVHCLEVKLKEMEDLQEEVLWLREELQRSNSEQFFLMQELQTKQLELQKSSLSIEKMEESISSMTLESQCEIESMKLDMMALEQSCFEAKKILEQTVDEKIRLSRLINELQVAFQDAQKLIISLNEENRELKRKLDTTYMNTRSFSQKIEDWIEKKGRSELNRQSSLSEQESNSTISEDIRLAMFLEPVADLKGEREKMSHQMQEYEFLVEKLKGELREEKLKAKEEAEDLAQEMAELRYQMTGLLDEERKRRACIEQASLQRIVELEAQLQREQKEPLIAVRHLPGT
ncbi:uncharacterized protein LOC133303063 isoform X2 [Gastrolobium bilobum]|uniref:uncharacterized protein LOC133303063 isoform X2 n=1 Tax=Gastrolobium bilobum TaxID=150636 RepID=UPI002AB15E5B|nr:uncharacterized protein LOC133303063 isoform X2 [Gastrolobium bilobum]